MSEKIYLLREAEIQSLVNNTITELLVRAGEQLIADGTDVNAVVALVTAVEERIGQKTDFAAPDPAPASGFPGLPEEEPERDTGSDPNAVEADEQSDQVQVDKRSIFEELKGLR